MKHKVQIQFKININLGRKSVRLIRFMQRLRQTRWLQAMGATKYRAGKPPGQSGTALCREGAVGAG